jgi:hypothetical protein
MSFVGRFFNRVAARDEKGLAEDVRKWAATVPGAVPMAEAPNRSSVKVAGIVRRITIWPAEGGHPEYLEALLTDGTGEVNVEWIGRRAIQGLALGTKLIAEGVIQDDRSMPGMRTMLNPKFEFTS